METEILNDIGLTKGEIKVYLALLELGETTAGFIKKKTKLQNSVVHLCIGNLVDKGLINYVEKGKRRFYTATEPEKLVSFLDEKRRRLNDILPALIRKQKEQVKYKVNVYEGKKGLKAIHEDILNELKQGNEFFVLGAPKEANEQFEPYFLDFHKRRMENKIKLNIIYKNDVRKYANVREKMPFTEIKYLPKNLTSPMWITTYKDKSILFVVGDILLGIVIENKTIAENFQEYFKLMWGIAEK
ncbi:MAG: helix-turn-helix domain-containing protein [Candidatus Pacearchaeota archaeon]